LPASPSAYLELAVRPRTGWYPARDLVAEIGLLAVLAWILAFGTHDLTHSLSRTRAALATARRRLHAANQRLIAEIERRQTLQKSLEHARYHDPFTGCRTVVTSWINLIEPCASCELDTGSALRLFLSPLTASRSSTIRWDILPAMN